jgi:ABC-type sugar transport system ATPase subunit
MPEAQTIQAGATAQGWTHRFILQVESVNMNFGAVTALSDVSMNLIDGEITGLVGDNGAGKSTLVKIISGVLRPSSGIITFDGAPVSFASPNAAREAGIETVFQDLALAPNMPVWANIFIGRELTRGPRALHILDRAGMIARTREMLARYDMNVPPIEKNVEGLSGGQRQIIAIARAAAWGSRLIIMDEPTAALGVAETRAVENVIRGLRAAGHSILIISHNLDQVFRLTDAIWVLRRGRMVGDFRTRSITPEAVVAKITGADQLQQVAGHAED